MDDTRIVEVTFLPGSCLVAMLSRMSSVKVSRYYFELSRAVFPIWVRSVP